MKREEDELEVLLSQAVLCLSIQMAHTFRVLCNMSLGPCHSESSLLGDGVGKDSSPYSLYMPVDYTATSLIFTNHIIKNGLRFCIYYMF